MRVVLILALVLSAAQAQSQLGTGALSGVVQDSSNAVITGADITLTNMETGLVRHMTSGSGGQFFAPVLPASRYKLLVSKPGFAALEQVDIAVNVGGTASLRVGAVAETIKVEGVASSIDPGRTS